jgi:hypothetical protein
MNVSNKFAYLVLIGLMVFFSRHRLLDAFSETKVPTGLNQQGTCLGKKMCAMVYVAPWCPACNGIESDLRMVGNLSASNPDFGVLIIVGGGQTAGENEAKVVELGSAAVTDNQNTYARVLRIRKYPTFLVVNSSNKLIHQDEDAIKWMDEALGFSL